MSWSPVILTAAGRATHLRRPKRCAAWRAGLCVAPCRPAAEPAWHCHAQHQPSGVSRHLGRHAHHVLTKAKMRQHARQQVARRRGADCENVQYAHLRASKPQSHAEKTRKYGWLCRPNPPCAAWPGTRRVVRRGARQPSALCDWSVKRQGLKKLCEARSRGSYLRVQGETLLLA